MITFYSYFLMILHAIKNILIYRRIDTEYSYLQYRILLLTGLKKKF
jgi:hypothetical protein